MAHAHVHSLAMTNWWKAQFISSRSISQCVNRKRELHGILKSPPSFLQRVCSMTQNNIRSNCALLCTMVQNNLEMGHQISHYLIHLGATKRACERTSERSAGRERSEQRGASERVRVVRESERLSKTSSAEQVNE